MQKEENSLMNKEQKEKELQAKEEQNESLADSKKIDLYINNNGEEEQGISIMNVFSTLGKRFHIYVFVMIVGLLAGLLVPTLMYTFKDKSESAVAVIGLDYANAEEGQAPDGSDLNISYLKSSYIVQNALDNVTLSKEVSTAQVQNNLKIIGILTDETRQKLDIIEELKEAKNNQYATYLAEFEVKYRAQYIISLKNGFSSGDKKVRLSTDDLSHLLSAITSAYNDYFIETYQDIDMPTDAIAAMNPDLLDYLEILDNASAFLTSLAEYCDNRSNLLPSFRSSMGLSFSELSGTIKTLRDANINDIYANIFLNNVCKDKYLLLNSYYSRKQAITSELSTLADTISKVKDAIDNYNPDQTTIQIPGGGSMGPFPSNSDYYNALVLQYSDLQAKKTSLEREQAVLDYRIAQLEGGDATPEQKAQVEAAVNDVLDRANDIYALVNKSAKELLNSNAYQNRYMHYVTTSESESFKDSLKSFLIGAGLGLGLAVVAWVADAFIIEFKNVKKVNEMKEAE